MKITLKVLEGLRTGQQGRTTPKSSNSTHRLGVTATPFQPLLATPVRPDTALFCQQSNYLLRKREGLNDKGGGTYMGSRDEKLRENNHYFAPFCFRCSVFSRSEFAT
ncbi:hypothetical protein AAMO2058_000754500 [Amorphochlora amoebiformis]